MGFKSCPGCGTEVGEWRASCECGHVFFRDKEVKREVVQEGPGELEDLIAGLEGGKSPAKRRIPRRESREVVVREYNDNRNPRPPASMAGSQSENRGVFRWLFLWAIFAVFVLIGIFSFPLQTIAACAVLFVLFVPVVLIVRR
jgi:hypothetical protein